MLHRFIVLDMDRTLFDSAEYANVIMEALSLTIVEERQAKAVLKCEYGNNFDFLSYLVDLKGLDYQQASELILHRSDQHRETLLMPGVTGLIAALDQSGDAYGILTTGTEQNQQLKLAILRDLLNKTKEGLPAEVTSVPDKSLDFIENRWNEARQAFHIDAKLSGKKGGVYAKTVVLIDDKSTNLTAKHPHVVLMHVPVNPTAEQHTLNSVADYIRYTAAWNKTIDFKIVQCSN